MIYDHTRRIGIYLDGNIYLRAYQYYQVHHPIRSRLDIGNFIEFVTDLYTSGTGREYSVVEKHFVRRHDSAADCKAKTANGLYNDRVFQDILGTENIILHNLPVIGAEGHKSTKGLDMELAMAVMDSVIFRRIDTAVLLVSDLNYLALLRQLRRCGIHIVLLSWEFSMRDDNGLVYTTATSEYLTKAADTFFRLDRIIEERSDTDEISRLFVPVPERPTLEPGRERSAILSLKDGYGFIEYPGNNLWFAGSELPEGISLDELTPGDIVEFEKEVNPKTGQPIAVKLKNIDI